MVAKWVFFKQNYKQIMFCILKIHNNKFNKKQNANFYVNCFNEYTCKILAGFMNLVCARMTFIAPLFSSILIHFLA